MKVAKGCTKTVADNGAITFSCRSKRWRSDAANRASFLTLFVGAPIVMVSSLFLNLGGNELFLSFFSPIFLLLILGRISKRVDTITIENSGSIFINGVAYQGIGREFDPIETAVDGTYVVARCKDKTIQVTGCFDDKQAAYQLCGEIRAAITSKMT